MKQCSNLKCKVQNPDKAKFCRKCGIALVQQPKPLISFPMENRADNCPFHIRHLELHLKPISEFGKLFFWFNKPKYVEDLDEAEDYEYLYIAREGKIGILYWTIKKHSNYGAENPMDISFCRKCNYGFWDCETIASSLK